MRNHSDLRKKKLPLLTYVAMYGLRRALRPFLGSANPCFVALLVVPDTGLVANYSDAASLIFRGAPADEYGFDDRGFKTFIVDDAKEADRTAALDDLSLCDRSVVFLSAPCPVSERMSMAADLVTELAVPTPAHFLQAASQVGISGMTTEDAEFLASVSFRDIAAAFAPGRPYGAAMRRLRAGLRDRSALLVSSRGQVTTTPFEELLGFDEVREWGLALGRDIALWKDGKLPWSEVDRGALLFGPPGTGKTMIASALADACGLSFVATSAAKWQAKGHLGDYLAAMRLAFTQASKKAPCLLFIDEVDSIGDRDSDRSDNAGYTRQAVNGVLEAMDGADRLEGVVMLGATNNVRVLDPAILRPGRLERVFEIALPDARQRRGILSQHLRPFMVDVPHAAFDKASAGMSGADLQMVARAAKRKARDAGRALTADDVLSALPSTRTLGDDEIRRICVHEVGHALIGLHTMSARLVGIFVNDVVVMGRPLQSIGQTLFERRQMTQKLASDYLGEIAMLMGGVAAEEVVFGVHSDGAGGSEGSDLALATDLATRIECTWGLGSTFVSELATDSANLKALRMRDPGVWRRVEQIVHGQFERARSILVEHRAALDAIVDEMVVRRAMSGEAVAETIAGASVARRA